MALPMGLSVRVERGELHTGGGDVTGLDLSFAQRVLMRSPAAIHLRAELRSALLPTPVPVTLDTDSLILSQAEVKSSEVRASVAGLRAEVHGASLLTEGSHRWVLKLQAPDLSRVPQPPSMVAAKDWRGAVTLNAEVSKVSARADWQADGEVAAKGVSAVLTVEQEGVRALGRFALDLDAKFSYFKGQPSLSKVSGSLNLTPVRVVYKDLFTKAADVPLSARVEGSGDGAGLDLKSLELTVWRARAVASGKIALRAPWSGDLKINVPPLNLNGLDGLVPALKRSPVKGELSLTAAVSGPLSQPAQSRIDIPTFRLKGFSAEVDYGQPGGVELHGPVAADVSARIGLSKGQVAGAKAQGTFNLTAAALNAGPLRKRAGQNLSGDFAIGNAGRQITIDHLNLRGFFGRLGARGAVTDPLDPKLDISLAAEPLDLTALRPTLPEFAKMIPDGAVRAHLRLKGAMAPAKPWSDWPLDVSGDIDAKLPEYKLVAAQAPPPSPQIPTGRVPKPEASRPLLPNGRLTASARLKIAASIARIVKDKLVVRGVAAHGVYQGGVFTGGVDIQNIFSGRAGVTGLELPLLRPRPVVRGTVSWSGLVIENALAFAVPEYKTFASGKTAGQASFTTVMPGEDDFMTALQAKGEATAEPVTLNTVKVGEMVNEGLKKVPILKIPPVKVDPLHGRIHARFDLRDAVAHLPEVTARDVDGSELRMQGSVVLTDMRADLSGNFLWARSPIKGCVAQGNSDELGRLIVPFALKGDLMKPGFSLVGNTVAKLGGRALECEKNRLLDKVKKQGAESLKKEVNKALEGIFGH
jgi:hypothetical protein